MMRALLCCSWLALAALCPVVALAQARKPAPANDAASMTAREIAVLEFIAVASLTPAERQQVAGDVQAALQTAPARIAEWDKGYVKLLALVLKLSPGDLEANRAARRTHTALPDSSGFELEPLASTERRILEAHDPAVVFDAANKRLVTERSLLILREVAAWTADEMGMPGPDGTFIDRARQGLRAEYSTLPREAADGFAHIAEYARGEPEYLKAMMPAQRDALFTQQRSASAAAGDPAERQWRLAKFTAGFAEAAQAASAPASPQALKQGPLPPPLNDPDRLLKLDIERLEFFLASPLTSLEREQLAAIVHMTWQTQSARMAAQGGLMMQDSARLAKLAPENVESIREQWRRLQVAPGTQAIEPWTAMERRIIEAHDPAVVIDPAQQRIVTERSLRAWRAAATWAAQVIGLPLPDDSFIDQARQRIRANYPTFSKELAEGIAHISQNVLNGNEFVATLVPAKRDALFAQYRAAIEKLSDPAEKQWWLASVTAIFAGVAHNTIEQRNTAMQEVMSRAIFARFAMMNMMLHSQNMITQQKNFNHALRHEPFQASPY